MTISFPLWPPFCYRGRGEWNKRKEKKITPLCEVKWNEKVAVKYKRKTKYFCTLKWTSIDKHNCWDLENSKLKEKFAKNHYWQAKPKNLFSFSFFFHLISLFAFSSHWSVNHFLVWQRERCHSQKDKSYLQTTPERNKIELDCW